VAQDAAVAWPICTAAPRFRKKPMSVTGTPSVRWTTAPGSENSRELWSNPARSRTARPRASPLPGDDHQLLQTVNRGEFLIRGFRNRTSQLILYRASPSQFPSLAEGKAPAFSGDQPQVENPRAHGLIKVPNLSLPGHFTRPTRYHCRPHHGPHEHRPAQQGGC